MITVLTEKPSVARELAALLNATQKREGFFQGEGYYITWALGHLVTLGLPEDYGLSGFVKDHLPILPSPFILTPRKGEGKERLLPDKRIVKQLVLIGELFRKSDSLIVATDAGREGELIFRYIYDYLNCTKPYKRMWISSLTEKALRHGLENLLPGEDFENLYLAARARSRADWLVGINASQALSIAAGTGTYSLGRVQTPTLGLICKRFLEHRDHKPVKYWQIQLSHTKSFTEFSSDGALHFDTPQKAEDALKSLQRQSHAVVIEIKSETVQEAAPLLFDLTAMQREANRKYGMTASETLEVAQRLYEKQFITYPRTGSRYVTQDVWAEIPRLIRVLQQDPELGKHISKIKFGRLNRHILNDGKVTDHHGLLITEKLPSALSVKEGIIYRMIALRLLESVSEPCRKEISRITLQVLHYDFGLIASAFTEPGWRSIRTAFDDSTTGETDVPELKVGDRIAIASGSIIQKQEAGPQLYTEDSLLSAMERIVSETGPAQFRKDLKQVGLGTPATRAAIIDSLLERHYVLREGRMLLPTPKGLEVYTIIADMPIGSAAMTADWEIALAAIEQGAFSGEKFQAEIETYTISITEQLLKASVRNEAVPELLCPKCGHHHLLFSDHAVTCPNQQCGWLQFRKVCGMILPGAEIENLIRNRSTNLLKGMVSKSGKKFNARLVLDDRQQVVFAFDK
ncbi:DNA topoisomerase [Flavobacterium sp. ST-75]|uniref:DNA topoisomerase n=1 Tax=Flavobacterium rhizophilum TaxID=3163296 RepID=A0ABW8YAD3_9FLAO